MAYVPTFSQITDDGSSDDEQRRLQGQEASSGTDASASPGGAGAPSQGGAANPAYTQSSFASGKKILQKANEEPLALQFGQQYKEEIGKAGTKLGEDTSKDLEAYNTAIQPFRFGDEDIKNAESGNDTKNLKGFLGKDYSSGGSDVDYKPFKADSLSFDPNQFSQLGTSVGLQGELSKAQNAAGNNSYTRGQSALDSVIYGGRPEVRSQIKDLGDSARDYISKATTAEKESQDRLKAIPGTLADEQQKIKGQLTGDSKAITDAATARAAELSKAAPTKLDPNDQRIRDLISDITGAAPKNSIAAGSDVYNALYPQTKNTTSLSRYGEGDYVNQALQDYIKQNPGAFVKANQINGPAYSADQAAQFNKIMDLVGGQHADEFTGNTSSVDYGGLSKKLQDVATGKQKDYEDVSKFQNDIDAMKADMQHQVELKMAHPEYQIDYNRYNGLNGNFSAQKILGKDPKTLIRNAETEARNNIENKIWSTKEGQQNEKILNSHGLTRDDMKEVQKYMSGNKGYNINNINLDQAAELYKVGKKIEDVQNDPKLSPKQKHDQLQALYGQQTKISARKY
jgi:hypothetical protein